MRKLIMLLTFITTLLVVSPQWSSAQCAMCKQNAESSLKEGDNNAKGLNAGILYLLVIPYMLVGGIGYYWYVNNKKKNSQEETDGLD